MTRSVEAAVAEVRAAFPGVHIDVDPEPQGGAYVLVHGQRIGDQYRPATSWIGFLITYQYPHADVYPHFVDGSLQRTDGASLGEGFSSTAWRDRAAVQVSRRSNRLDPAVDTAASKLAKVLAWIESR